MAKISVKIKEAYGIKAERERLEQITQERERKKRQYQAKLAELADKKAKGKLALENVDAKLDLIIEILQDLMPPK